MKYDYQFRVTFKLDEPFDVEYIKKVCSRYPNQRILVEVQNTKGITSSMIKQLDSNVAIRIAGGYDSERINRYGKDLFWSSNYYEEAVIYTKNETIKLLEEMEKVESGINKNWSDIQKLIYIYDRLKSGIMYDPKYERKLSSEIRSLRGLITKNTVCAGYAMILKEFMDRNGIDCEYVEGHIKIDNNGKRTQGHAWNIITIDGKKYPIDLTWDNTKFRSGKSVTFDWLGQDVSKFSECHHPSPGEKTQDYRHTLSQIDPQIIKQLYSQMGVNRSKSFNSTTYYGTRKDGSRFIVAQVGDARINNEDYYRYYFVELGKDGRKGLPLILYSKTNLTHFVNEKNFNNYVPDGYEDAIDNILFSRENINNSIKNKTYYIGKVRKNSNSNKLELVSSVKDIENDKNDSENNLFIYPTRRFTRSDGSVFIVQQMLEKPRRVNGIDVMMYDVFEMVNENGQEVLKRNVVFTERSLFRDNRQSMIDNLLSRERLDRKSSETGGYIGYYDVNEVSMYNPDLVTYFETAKRLDIDSLNVKNDVSKISIPSFAELKDLVEQYEIVLNADPSNIKVRDILTGQIQTDQEIVNKAIFANVWLSAAGVKVEDHEARVGENYAFNNEAEKLYNTICEKLLDSCKNKHVIDTIELLKNIENDNDYKYNREIIVNLFRTPYQTELINKLFLNSLGMDDKNSIPEPLYSMSYAGSLAYGNSDDGRKGR